MSSGHEPPRPWPDEDVEALGRCPVCGTAVREPIHTGLVDRMPGADPGYWTLWRCFGCEAGYIDPRPTADAIGRAYRDYYTHTPPAASRAGARDLRSRVMHGYLNRRFGHHAEPASRLGALVPLMPGGRAMTGQYVRELPPGEGRRLLDVGCGNADFLVRMRDLGWEVAGQDVDEASAAFARAAGVEVAVADMLTMPYPEESFDAITINHAIEHLHDPVAVLDVCRRMLRAGGGLWVATPNVDAALHAEYGRRWAPLDPPRHLIQFSRRALAEAVRRAGFTDLRWPPVPQQALRWVAAKSEAMRTGADMDAPVALPWRARRAALAADLRATARREAAEEVVLMARRPER